MCREYVDLAYLMREAEEGMKDTARRPVPAAAADRQPTGGLVAVMRGLLERLRLAKTTVPAE